jgi:hypothetical protein
VKVTGMLIGGAEGRWGRRVEAAMDEVEWGLAG